MSRRSTSTVIPALPGESVQSPLAASRLKNRLTESPLGDALGRLGSSSTLPRARGPVDRRHVGKDDVAQAFAAVRTESGPRVFGGTIVATVLLCVLPAVLLIDEAVASRGVFDMVLPMRSVGQALDMLAGAFVHTILEWSSVMGSLIAFIIAMLHFHVRRNLFVPAAMAAFLMCSAMDCLHTLYADHLIDAPEKHPDWVPFTWAMSRAVAAVSSAAVAVCLCSFGSAWQVPQAKMRLATMSILVSVALMTAAAAGINMAAATADLPSTQYVGQAVSRPFDVAPLVVFALVLVALCTWTARHGSDVLVDGVIRAVIIDISIQAYMAFGSDQLFDAAFNIAHFLKAVRAVVPAIYFVADIALVYSSQRQNLVITELIGRVEGERLLDEFVTTSTHDLGTPLLAFSAGCDILGDMELADEASSVLNMMKSACQMMTMTRSNVLNYTRIIKGMPLQLNEAQVMRWDDIVHSVVVVVVANGQMVSERVALRCIVDVRLARPLCGERTWMQQCLVNLVTNAAKFTEDGYVHIDVAVVDDDVEVRVTDTGPGIPARDRRTIFDKFAQIADAADRPHTAIDIGRVSSGSPAAKELASKRSPVGMRRLGGTGVGLFSLATQVAALGGQVGVRDNPERQGSMFWFTIPRSRFTAPPNSAVSPGPASGARPLNHMWKPSANGASMMFEMPAGDHGKWLNTARSERPAEVESKGPQNLFALHEDLDVLLVDDVRTNRRLLQLMLQKFGIRGVDTAAHGREALEKLQRKTYDLVLMDIQMPVMDGISATMAYRNWEAKHRPGQHVYIVALSAMTYVEDDPTIKDSGFDAFQMKPVDMKQLEQTVRQVTISGHSAV